MISYRDIQIQGSSNINIHLDVFFPKNKDNIIPVIFSHGFKGFKDWGFFNEIGKYFAEKDLFFLKFNFSHNGVKFSNDYFTDLELFGNNNLSKELDDLGFIIDWLYSSKFSELIDFSKLTLIGHSRGGGISMLKASEDIRVKKLITWGSVYDFYSRPLFAREKKCKETGYIEIFNTRTKQKMPINYQFFKDLKNNKNRLSIKKNFNIKVPTLLIHGQDDKSISVDEAISFSRYFDVKCLIIKSTGHTFDAKHPKGKVIPSKLLEVLDMTLKFVKF